MRLIKARGPVLAIAAAVAVGTSACGTTGGQPRDAAARGVAASSSRGPGAKVSGGAGEDAARGRKQPAAQAARRATAPHTPSLAAAPARTLAAEGPQSPAKGQQAAAHVGQRGLLREFLTVSDQGYFYTAYTPEARAAVNKFHFHPTGATFGYVDASQAKGTMPLFRLHVVGRQAYIVTPDVSEKNSLLASHKFTLDGVLGYVLVKPATGAFAIWRLGKGPQPYWRLATTAQEKVLVKQGWHLDGLVGYVWAKA